MKYEMLWPRENKQKQVYKGDNRMAQTSHVRHVAYDVRNKEITCEITLPHSLQWTWNLSETYPYT